MSFRPTCHPIFRREALDALTLCIDGAPATAYAGETLLTFLLRERGALRHAEFGPAPSLRAGFCAMGACQDCWVGLSDGRRVRACSTFVEPGLDVVTGLENAVC